MPSTPYPKQPLLLAAAALALALPAASGSAQPTVSKPKKANWGAMIAATDGGHLLGNPDAPTKLVEFMSYTCSHCAEFARVGEGAIKLAYVPTGKVSYEIRHLIRDPVDLAATLLTHCGAPAKFAANHAAIMARYPEWMAKAKAVTQAQRARWQFGTNAARFQAIASDLGFYDIMTGRGYARSDVNTCLSDEAKAKAVVATSQADIASHGLKGTPSFVMNGTLLDGVHDWDALRPAIDGAL